ncbi:MAG: methylmalonyl-CoA mutase family protein [Pseudomonadota bacterium]
MTDQFLSLSSEFEAASETDWLESVSKALKGGGIERLVRTTEDGVQIKPLYRESDWPSSTDPLGAPGQFPFIRGAEAERDRYLPWDIRQIFAHPDIRTSNAEILRDLERGVSSIELAIDPSGQRGIAVGSAEDLRKLLDGVNAEIAPIALSAIRFSDQLAVADWASEALGQNSQIAFNIDPLGALAKTGLVEEGIDAAFSALAQRLPKIQSAFPNASLLRVDARPVHEAGGSEAQELAASMASAVDTLRRLQAAGLEADELGVSLLFTLSIDANYGRGIAKLRAARRLWARVQEALGLKIKPMKIQAVTSGRMLTRYDPWVNLLRNTAACFAAGVGGADIITVRPFTDALGIADELGRRTARNTQLIAQEEASLGRVADPAGGAWFVEKLADDLAQAAWAEFQTIESEGGYADSLMSDRFQARIADIRTQRGKAIAKGKVPVTGVSAFPLLDEISAPVAMPVAGVSEGSVDLANPSGEVSEASPLWPITLAAPFERLRDHAANQAVRPKIFLATLGPLAEHNARADYARNLFAAGGIEAVSVERAPETHAELANAFKSSGCVLAVLCGSDPRYQSEAADAAEALKAAGVQRLYLAGRPGEHEAAWQKCGIDSFIHIGVDTVATLELAHAELGVS